MKRLDQIVGVLSFVFLLGFFLIVGTSSCRADDSELPIPTLESNENLVYETPPLPTGDSALELPKQTPTLSPKMEEEVKSVPEPPAPEPVAQTQSEPSVATSAGHTPLSTASGLLDKSGLLGNSKVGGTVKIALLFTVLSLVPAILMMTTSFVRIMTVLSILRQGLGTGQIPPTQVLTTIAVFMTFLVMTPTMTDVWNNAIRPYSAEKIDLPQALSAGEKPIRTFLCQQIERAGNTDTIWLFMQYIPGAQEPKYYEDIPWRALLPAFIISELKTAFAIGFQILLPFLIIDLVVSGITVSMGMMMLPPAVVSLPLKLLLFVLADGWSLVVKTLLDGFVIGST